MKILSPLLILLLAQLFSTMVEARVFTNKQGREIDAEIISVASPEVKIKRADGKVFTMLIDTFTDEDQAFIRTWKPAGAPPAGAPPAPPANSDLKPGETLKLDFPDLAPDRKGEPATCNVKLPGSYDPAKRYPLVVWLAGGDGGNQPGGGFVPEGDFVTAGLPFPKDANNPAQANMVGEFDLIWEFHRAMLDEIHRRVPNIERSSSVIGGFSNGAHAIDGMLRVLGGKEGGLADYFAVFVLADLSDANLVLADLSNANLTGTKFIGANLESAILRGAYLALANLKDARLNGADLTDSSWWRARGLTSDQIVEFAKTFPPTDTADESRRNDFGLWLKTFAK